ncbi:MAG TPA: DoxX family protein [Caulobacteraceae bacterium]|jgi:putative oxidoreductase
MDDTRAGRVGGFDGRTGPLALLALRLVIGALFIAHLYWKFAILPSGFAGWWAGFAHNHYPAFVPAYVFSAELAGAVLIAPGLWARWAALYALPMMLGAAQFWLARKGFYFTAAGGELPLVWAALLALLAGLGDGPYAIAASPMPWGRSDRGAR